jgi:hypothetical protein
VNEISAERLALRAGGPAVIEVVGATASTVHVTAAGSGSTLPALSRARTEKVCEPSASPV